MCVCVCGGGGGKGGRKVRGLGGDRYEGEEEQGELEGVPQNNPWRHNHHKTQDGLPPEPPRKEDTKDTRTRTPASGLAKRPVFEAREARAKTAVTPPSERVPRAKRKCQKLTCLTYRGITHC